MKDLRWINTGAFAAMITVNALAELLPIGGMTTGQISALYPNLFTPAPFTFAIWGLIYLLMMLFTVYQHGVLDGGVQSRIVREKIGPWFAVSCILNILWILLWHFQLIALSVLCMAVLLMVLYMIIRRLDALKAASSPLQRLASNTGFSLYWGWIIAASIANISVYLTERGWSRWGLSEDFWTVVILLTGAIIAAAIVRNKQNRIAAVAVMWAYAGILFRHISPAYYSGAHPYVIAAGFISEVLMLAAILLPGRLKLCRNQALAARQSTSPVS